MGQARSLTGLAVGLVAVLAWAIAVPLVVDDYWLRILTTAVTYTVAAAGVGVLFSRLGIVSLNQIALMGVGGWIYLRISYWLEWTPPLVVLLVAGLVTMVIGVLIGLPSLRLSGLSLAVVTLMFAAFAEIAFTSIGFPKGNFGWNGEPAPGETSVPLPRPPLAESNTALWFYIVVIATVMLILLWFFLTGRWGRAWAAIRQSEPGAMSIGVHVTSSKVIALAVVSFTTGVSGGLLAVPTGSLVPQTFTAISSVVLFAVVLIGGAFSLVGAVLAGLLAVALPPALEALVSGMPFVVDLLGPTFTNLIYVIFGIGLIQSLVASPRGIAGDMAGVGMRVRRAVAWPPQPRDVGFALLVIVLPPSALVALGPPAGLSVVVATWLAVWLVATIHSSAPQRALSGALVVGIMIGLAVAGVGVLVGVWPSLGLALVTVVVMVIVRRRRGRVSGAPARLPESGGRRA